MAQSKESRIEMDFDKALEISIRFQEAYDTLFRINGQKLEERARPYIGMIEDVTKREKCSSVEAVLIILKNWHNGSQTIPSSALTLWLLASAVILEDKERVQLPLFAEQGQCETAGNRQKESRIDE